VCANLLDLILYLSMAVSADAAVAAEPGISPRVLALWEANVRDPLVVMAALDLLQALAGIPACLASLQVGKSQAPEIEKTLQSLCLTQ